MKLGFYIVLIGGLFLAPSVVWAKEYNLNLLWQTPIGGKNCEVLSEDGRLRRCDRGKGIQLLYRAVRGSNLSFWGWNLREGAADRILIDDLIKDGFEDYKTIELQENYNDLTWGIFNKHKKGPAILDITSDNQNKIWVVGYTDRVDSLTGRVTNRNYLASIDENGKTDFEKRYAKQEFSGLSQIVPFQKDTFLVAGGRNIGRVDRTGKYLWESNVGMAKGLSFGTNGSRILAVGMVGHGKESGDYWENFESRLLDEDGNIMNTAIVWEKVNDYRGGYYADVDVLADESGFFSVTRWGNKFIRDKSLIKPIKVTRFSNDGAILWQTDLKTTLGKDSLDRVDICSYPTMIKDGNNLLVACTLSGNIRFYTFANGQKNYVEYVIPLPQCHEPRVAKLSLFSRPDNHALYLVGTRSSGNSGASCSWLGHLKPR